MELDHSPSTNAVTDALPSLQTVGRIVLPIAAAAVVTVVGFVVYFELVAILLSAA